MNIKYIVTGLAMILALLGSIYIGCVNSYQDEGVKTIFFVKKFPTFQFVFYDVFANESDDKPIEELAPDDRRRFADYCKYRFGIFDASIRGLERCKEIIPSYLK